VDTAPPSLIQRLEKQRWKRSVARQKQGATAMKKFVPLVGLLAGGLCVASAAHAAMVWSSAVTISKLDVEGDPSGSTGPSGTWMKFSAVPLAHGCSASTGTWQVGGSTDNIKSITQFALAAKLAGASVKILFNDSHSGTASCSGGASSGYPILRGIELQ
jgi:hypothetical protein